MSVEKERYSNIDGLRAYAAIGIVMMHVLSNGKYGLNGFVFEKLIPAFTDFVFLFMVISAFSMCCGYYEKVLKAQITPSEFYIKRFKKVLPFFALLCAMDFALSPSVNSLYEVFANLTLCFGLLPNANISVIGVGWFLGLIFVFYFMFPFFCVLLETKRRAWFSFAAALIFHYLCIVRFHTGRTNIMYCAVYFLAGGMVFLYRNELREFVTRRLIIFLIGIVVAVVLYYNSVQKTMSILLLCVMLLIVALKTNKRTYTFLSNPVTTYLSKISMEIYLCHMVIFRALEMFGVTHLFKTDSLSYLICCFGTILGVILFLLVVQKTIGKVRSLF